MATSPLICTKEQDKTVIGFLWAEGVKGVELTGGLLAQHGETRTVKKGSVAQKCSSSVAHIN
jgi:hypothetical protein